MPVDIRYVDAGQGKWKSARTGLLYPDEVPPTPELGAVTYTRATVDAWNTTDTIPSTSTSAYSNLQSAVSSFFSGGLTRSITDRGTGPLQGVLRDAGQGATGWLYDARYAKCMALLWAASGTTAYRNKVIEVLDSVKDCRDIQYSGKGSTYELGQQKLELSWAVPNWCEAAWIISYDQEPGYGAFNAFLDSIYTRLLWRIGGNWHATMANSRMSIANYRNSATKKADALAFGEFYIRRAVYHQTYDGANIVPTVNVYWDENPQTAPASSSVTVDHWENSVQSNYLARDPRSGYTFISGIDAEFRRDWNHGAMALTGWVNWARNIIIGGGTVPAHAHARIVAFAAAFAQRVLYIIDHNGTGGSYAVGTQDPAFPTYDDGTNDEAGADRTFAHAMVWVYVVKTYLGSAAPAAVNTLMTRSRINASGTNSTTGWNAVAGEKMAEGSLL
jgi:hypothetical protein